ncbi:hypothetical protein SLS60_001764 [Paraconiothyrium brasiliense]|uniref:Uncharacterized protein n=1 Tax=Paraconiothyrium brasiliense TaxID=300254 RepID=A0ABR3S096_9PLEO
MDGARFRALDINSAGQLASPALSTPVLSTPTASRPRPLRVSFVEDAKMDDHDKENATGEIVNSDTPVVLEAEEKHISRSAVKTSTQVETRQSTPARTLPLGPPATPKSPAKNLQSHNGVHAPHRLPSPVKNRLSRPSSPIKTPRSRPSSRSSSPLKRTPAPGKNEHFETTPTGFRYTIELPESKIVPKKDSGATPSKSKISTPMKGFALVDSTSKTNNPKRASSPSKYRSASPRKELLQTHAASPEKKSVEAGVDQAEPIPTVALPKGHRKRDSVKLTQTNGVHAGTPTVELTRGDVWTSPQLRSPVTSKTSSVDTQVKGSEANEDERRPGMNGVSPSPASMECHEESTPIEEKASVSLRKQSIPTNFGEMLRNSSQDVLYTRRSLFDEAPDKKQFSSPTIMEKARRKSEIVTGSLPGVVAKPNFNGESLMEDAGAPVVKDFANAADDGTNKVVPEESRTKVHKSQADRRVSFASTPRTPTGTPPSLIAAIEADMQDICNGLRRSLGDGFAAGSRSPDLTRWLGSSPNHRSPSNLPLGPDPTNTDNAPRRSLQVGMAAAKQKVLSRRSSRSKKTALSPLPLRTTSKIEGKEPYHSRLPRLSPTKLEPQPRMPGTIPQAPRTSLFEVAKKTAPLTPSRVPAMASHRARYTRETQGRGETVGFASAQDIAKQVEEWNNISQSPEKKPAVRATQLKTGAKTPNKMATRAMTTTPRSQPTFMSPTATSSAKSEKRKERKSYTPPGSPATPGMLPRSPIKAVQFPTRPAPSPPKKNLAPLKNPKIRALTAAAPQTPLPRNKRDVEGMDRGAFRTPSKEMGNKLDREIDAHLEREARAGRVFTPSGQRISDLLARRRESVE